MNQRKIFLLVCFLFPFLGISEESEKKTLSLSLSEYLQNHNQKVTEGYISNTTHLQVDFFVALLKDNPSIKHIAEIGFNAGHSSELFLQSVPDAKVVAFDIMKHGYAKLGKAYIDLQYPGRHRLIEGNSIISVPAFQKEHATLTFDLIFIDGGHDFQTALHDIINMKMLASPHTFLVVDDIKYKSVALAWEKCVQKGLVKEQQRFAGGGKAWVLGQYRF